MVETGPDRERIDQQVAELIQELTELRHNAQRGDEEAIALLQLLIVDLRFEATSISQLFGITLDPEPYRECQMPGHDSSPYKHNIPWHDKGRICSSNPDHEFCSGHRLACCPYCSEPFR
jgi:hypothetical protein